LSLSRAIRLAVAITLTAYVVWQSNPRSILEISSQADLQWVASAVALVVVDRGLNAYRWVVLLRALTPGSRPPLGSVMRIFFVSSFVGNFLPSVGGDVYRAYTLAQLDVRPAEAAASVLMDRVLGVLSMVVVAAAALALIKTIDVPGVVPLLLIAAAGCGVAAAGVFSERAAVFALTLAAKMPSPRISRITRGLTDAVRRYAAHHGALLLVLTLSILVQTLRVVQAYCLGRSLEIAEPLSLYFALVPLITLVMQVPVTVGGLGTTQYAFEKLFGYAGVAAPQAVALSILFLALGTIGNLPGGLLYAIGGRPRQ
jgi:glycosyltransferase 2 family protein